MDRLDAAIRARLAPTAVVVLSHQIRQARDFICELERVIASINRANPRALHLACADQASQAASAQLCLLLSWDSADPSPSAGDPDLDALQAHQSLRKALQAQGTSFAVLRGDRSGQIRQALAALSRLDPALKPEGAQTLAPAGWQAQCDRCSDPQCEHRLLQDLLARQ